jgi:class 3 adenylate cyclase
VLFVDIRGYTGFSEPREAEEIFHTVNRYTETVSKLVQARGGVVEFTGDGMKRGRALALAPAQRAGGTRLGFLYAARCQQREPKLLCPRESSD